MTTPLLRARFVFFAACCLATTSLTAPLSRALASRQSTAPQSAAPRNAVAPGISTPSTSAPKLTSLNINAKSKTSAPAKTVKPNSTISADQYAKELRGQIEQLDKWQKGALPTIPAVRNLFPTSDERRIRRDDGATQAASGAQWDRLLDSIEESRVAKTRVRKSDIQELRAMLASRLLELQRWMKGDIYQPAAAQGIVSTLADEGQIQTGPTATQLWWQSVRDAISNFFANLFKRSATAATPSKPLDINPIWANWLFASCVLCLLSAIGWYLWKTLGGKWVRGARREVRFVGEDAELLQLPPDELLSRAGQLARKGDFAGALRHRFIGVLVTLDERGVWRYDTRRTNWEHIAALKKKSQWNTITNPLSDLTRHFDRVRYGNAPCLQTDWTRFDADSEKLEILVTQTATSSTRSASNSTTGARA